MKIIGLTGNISSGKSSVSKILEALGAIIIDADQISRDMVKPKSPALNQISHEFGKEVLDKNGELNRQKLGEIIFRSPEKREKLNKILHPLIKEELKSIIKQYEEDSMLKVLVLEIPLLVEAKMQDLVDEIWLITINPDIQLERLQKRNNLSLEEAILRVNSQMKQEEKLNYANKIIDNSRGLEQTKKQIINLWQEII